MMKKKILNFCKFQYQLFWYNLYLKETYFIVNIISDWTLYLLSDCKNLINQLASIESIKKKSLVL